MPNDSQKRREYKELSQHITYIDTLKNQDLLRKRVEELKRKNECLKPSERTEFLTELSKALCGEGTLLKVYLHVKDGMIPFDFLHYFGEKLAYLHTNRIKIRYKGKTYLIKIRVLWDLLLDGLLRVYPFAQKEAHKRSAERERYETGGTFAYEPSKRE
jgi:hypothetical protein